VCRLTALLKRKLRTFRFFLIVLLKTTFELTELQFPNWNSGTAGVQPINYFATLTDARDQ